MADNNKENKKNEKRSEVTLVSQLDSRKPMYRLEGKAPRIETGIDRLYNMIGEKGSIGLSDAAKKMGMTEDKVMEWGDILEDHKLADLHYPVKGKPVLSIRKVKLAKAKKIKEKKAKVKREGVPLRKRFSKKVMLIYAEIIILGELLIYIFYVNRYLTVNFIPTIRFHFNGFMAYLRGIPSMLASGNISGLWSQPMYLAFLIIVLVIIILIIVLIVKSRKPGYHIEKTKKKEDHTEDKKHREEIKKQEKSRRKEEEKRNKEEKKKKKQGKKREEKHKGFVDIVEKYKERLREME
jgi:uncharacterized membrane protein